MFVVDLLRAVRRGNILCLCVIHITFFAMVCSIVLLQGSYLADALPPLVISSLLRRMLWRQAMLLRSSGCFAAVVVVVAGCSGRMLCRRYSDLVVYLDSHGVEVSYLIDSVVLGRLGRLVRFQGCLGSFLFHALLF